jgi:glutamate-1-semialdehyde 2,1-aminomutase
MATIQERYIQKFGKSMEWYERGKSLFAGGITHQTRFIDPFPNYIERGEGPYKYDVDGNKLIDYVMGSGPLIMGHSPPEINAAVIAAVQNGTHLGGASTHEIRYAEAVQRLMPSMERIRFTSSGTESTFLALRVARAYTGKNKIVKFEQHYHGWHDYTVSSTGINSPGGVPQAVLDTVVVCPVDTSALDKILSEDDDIAAVTVEGHGAHWGTYPCQNPRFLQDVREITERHGVVFVLDEVITGFRLSPGGAQMRYDVTPDLTTLGKIVGGGQPASAVGGKIDIMEMMAYRGDPEFDDVLRAAQSGTYNAQPVAAAAGIATLEAIATQPINARADAMAQRLKDGLNEEFARNEVSGHSHGVASIIHVTFADCDCDREICTMPHDEIHEAMPKEKQRALRKAMLVHDVDLMGGRGFMVSSVHDEEVTDRTIEAFSQALKDLREERVL